MPFVKKQVKTKKIALFLWSTVYVAKTRNIFAEIEMYTNVLV